MTTERAMARILYQTVENAYSRMSRLVTHGGKMMQALRKIDHRPDGDPTQDWLIFNFLPREIFVEAMDRLLDTITDEDVRDSVAKKIVTFAATGLDPNSREAATALGVLCTLVEHVVDNPSRWGTVLELVLAAAKSPNSRNRASALATLGVLLHYTAVDSRDRAKVFGAFLHGCTDPDEDIRKDMKVNVLLVRHDVTDEEDQKLNKHLRMPAREEE